MASIGVRFTHAWARPLCTPTRLQLMTGLYKQRNWRAFGIMDPKEVTFGHRMRDLRYRTAIAEKWQFYSYNPLVEDLVGSTDFPPTMSEAAGARLPAGVPFDGPGFLPQVLGRKGAHATLQVIRRRPAV